MPTPDVDTSFAALLEPRFRIQDLERDPAIIFGLWPDSRLAYVNPAWSAFAAANAGQPTVARDWGLGARYLDAIAHPLRPFYAGLLSRAPDPSAALHPVSHEYECSSPTVYRRFGMQVYALPDRAGCVVVNSLLVETAHDDAERPPHAADRQAYVDARGIIVQCSHCRRVRRADEPSQWDWVPAWVLQSPPETSHGLCTICYEYYYPDDGDA